MTSATARPSSRRARALAALLLALAASGCAGRYFQPAEPPPAPVATTLGERAWQGYWTGIVFNGGKIGFTHLAIEPQEDGYRIAAQAALRFRFLTLDKQVNMTGDDWVDGQLRLRRFRYRHNLDGNQQSQHGEVDDQMLTLRIEGRETRTERFALSGPLYPTSVINLFPLLHGLTVGRRYQYLVYDGETQQLATVTQEILAYETSTLFSGAAFKVRTRLHDNEVTTWIDDAGLPVLEMTLGGVLISGLEDEAMARRYLAEAALNKDETLVEFSRVPVDRPIAEPRGLRRLRVALEGFNGYQMPPSDGWQRCARRAALVECSIGGAERTPPDAEALRRYLGPSSTVPSRHPDIERLAAQIIPPDATRSAQLGALLRWMDANIEKTAIDVFSALDVLERRKAECQGHSYLFAALARAEGIPTRVVNGMVYSEPHQGFLYHTWVESWSGDHWQVIDPTFGQLEADASHIKLVEGETPADLAPLIGVIGRLRARVIETDP